MNGNGRPKAQQGRGKKQKEPFIQISSLILNSAAYKDLNFSARSMLVELLHYYNGRNNGCIFMSREVINARGFSRNTATKAFRELTSHGLIYMTRRGGNITGGCSWYALTWLPIDRADGQQLGNFVRNAYEKWQPIEKNDGSKFGAAQHHNLGLKKHALITH